MAEAAPCRRRPECRSPAWRSRCGARTFTSGAFSSAAKRRRCSSSMHRARRLASAGRGQGRGRAAAGRLLCTSRQRRADRLSRPRAELLLPPTRSLVRAKRSLAGLPGGGGTPLAAGLVGRPRPGRRIAPPRRDAGAGAADRWPRQHRAGRCAGPRACRRRCADRGAAPAGRGLCRSVARHLAAAASAARELAAAMGARYLPLPHAVSAAMSQAVRVAAGAG